MATLSYSVTYAGSAQRGWEEGWSPRVATDRRRQKPAVFWLQELYPFNDLTKRADVRKQGVQISVFLQFIFWSSYCIIFYSSCWTSSYETYRIFHIILHCYASAFAKYVSIFFYQEKVLLITETLFFCNFKTIFIFKGLTPGCFIKW